MSNNFKSASGYYLIGNLFSKGIAFLTVPIFSRVLSTYDYGIVTTYNSWITILSMIIGFAIHMGIRAAFIDYSDRIDDVMSVTTTFTLFCGAIITVLVGVFCVFIPIGIGIPLLILCMIQGIASAMIQNYSMYLMMKYRYKFRTALMIFPNLISTLISIFLICVVMENNLYLGRIIPTALITIGTGVALVILVYKKSLVLFDKSILKYALRISMPLVVHGIAQNILSQSDRTMITLLADASQTGIYSLIYNFSMIATVITTAMEGVWIPWFTDKLKERQTEEINYFAKKYVLIMAYLMAGVILIGPEVVKLLADEKYWEGISIIPPIVISNYLIFAYSLFVNVEHFHKKTIYITYNTLVAATINLILNYILIPKFGYVGAAYTSTIAYLISLLMHARYAKKIEKELFPLRYFILPIIFLSAAVVVFYCFESSFIIRMLFIIGGILYVLLTEKELLRKLVINRK